MNIQVTMTMEIEDSFFEEAKKWEHHIDGLIDLDSYPEIKHVRNVHVKKDDLAGGIDADTQLKMKQYQMEVGQEVQKTVESKKSLKNCKTNL